MYFSALVLGVERFTFQVLLYAQGSRLCGGAAAHRYATKAYETSALTSWLFIASDPSLVWLLYIYMVFMTLG